MKRSKPLVRKSPLRAKGKRTKKSGGHLFPKSVDDGFRRWIREHPCCFCLALGKRQRHPTECEHLRTRGAGGADQGNIVPTCGVHREERDRLGFKSFAATYQAIGLDVWGLATALATEYGVFA